MAQAPGWAAPLLAEFDRLALAAFGATQAHAKADGTAVTGVDLAASELVERTLKRFFPADGIISEEAPPHLPEAPRVWVVDPLDGTAAFARGFPAWGLGLGLLEGGQPVEGYLSFPALGEVCAFSEGRFLRNGQPFDRPLEPPLPDTRNVLVSSTSHLELPLHRLRRLKLRNFGSNLYHMASVALGRAEAMITGRCKIWDLVPALPFCRAQGCIEIMADGSPFALETLLRGNPPDFGVRQPIIIGRPHQVREILAQLAG